MVLEMGNPVLDTLRADNNNNNVIRVGEKNHFTVAKLLARPAKSSVHVKEQIVLLDVVDLKTGEIKTRKIIL
jgi:hypothetical protein